MDCEVEQTCLNLLKSESQQGSTELCYKLLRYEIWYRTSGIAVIPKNDFEGFGEAWASHNIKNTALLFL